MTAIAAPMLCSCDHVITAHDATGACGADGCTCTRFAFAAPAAPAPSEPEPTLVRFGGRHNEALPWNPLPFMEEYLAELEHGESPKSPEYLRPVKVGLGHFAAFAASEGVTAPNDITRDLIVRFQSHLTTLHSRQTGRPLSLSYRQQVMKYLRGWINWLEGTRRIDDSPWYRIRVGRVAKQPKPLEDAELLALFDAHARQAFSIAPFSFHRREVILTLLYGWGLRLHELQGLNEHQFRDGATHVIARNKGGGSKKLPVSPEMHSVILRWLPHRARRAVPGEDALIIDQSGGRLSLARIREIVIDCGERANITINPHRLRDTCATSLLEANVPVEQIMAILGHTKRERTMSYARVSDTRIAESHGGAMDPRLQVLLGHTRPAAR